MTTPAPHPAARRLDRKLANIIAGRYTPDDFVIADAKDADLAFGVTAPGPAPGHGPDPATDGDGTATDARPATGGHGPGRYRTRPAYLGAMRALAVQGELDILLASASNGERLAHEDALGTEITLAVRANDTTDIWNQRGSCYPSLPSRPFRTADLTAVRGFCDLVLYSVTFNNDLDHDLATAEAYAGFRREAADLGLRHFLEVFNPNAPTGLAPNDVGPYVNDCIVRTLAGITQAHRPLFLKVAYNGADTLGELVEHDPSLVVGILGGSAGTTRDAFELLHRAEVLGARVALFGRKIQRAESQLDLVRLMRQVIRRKLTPADAVRAYHDALGGQGVASHRALAADLRVTDPVLRAE